MFMMQWAEIYNNYDNHFIIQKYHDAEVNLTKSHFD